MTPSLVIGSSYCRCGAPLVAFKARFRRVVAEDQRTALSIFEHLRDAKMAIVNAARDDLMQDMQTLQLLRQYLESKVAIDPAKVTPDARLEEIGVDSLVLIDLMFELEESLNVRLPDVDTRPTTVGELTQIFDSLTAQQLKTGT